MIYDDVTGCGIILPDAPGLGARIDEEFLQNCEQYSVKP
jgi:L-alanine-DL-glutamate epimerase-like enolase superfamily enzyme